MTDAGGARPRDDLDALVERLQKKSLWGKFGWEPDEDAREAAAALVQLREQRDEWHKAWIGMEKRAERAESRIAALEAERDALREPTETMIVAGVKTLLTGHDSQRHYVAALWRRMFDAAKEKP